MRPRYVGVHPMARSWTLLISLALHAPAVHRWAGVVALVLLLASAHIALPTANTPRLLDTAQLAGRLGGSCSNIGCVEGGECGKKGGATPCPTDSTTCTWDASLKSCVKITTVNHNECAKRYGYEECSISLSSQTCGNYFAGPPMPPGSTDCPDYTCTYKHGCGENHQHCTSKKCVD